MNLVGKIFIVLIFVMSLVFMSFSMAVYSTHKNWREDAMAKSDLLDESETLVEQLRGQLDRQTNDYATEEAILQQTLLIAITERDALITERDVQDQELARKQEGQDEAIATLKNNQDLLTNLTTEVEGLWSEIRDVQDQHDVALDRVIDGTDEIHDLANRLAALDAINQRLAADNAKATEVLRKFDMVAEPDRYSGTPPRVEGFVSAVRDGSLLEINIGEDDGLMKGHPLHIFRIGNNQSVYLGKVEVIKTEADKAVCKVLPDFRKGIIQEGDNVGSTY